ncbi:tetratricopeptide repeat protein [Pseudomonas piscis]|uniref:tetratricopeptide repeat protein n=1 Tax=Pseudomonas piscis TaxID=2614538 RepID=UPI0021D5E94D|nr:tetratricopeptide repeat protein [Pseudomonas piscis]MCU7646535.1 tetratricopeptide repeat protein [Pseudomonas piscis]
MTAPASSPRYGTAQAPSVLWAEKRFAEQVLAQNDEGHRLCLQGCFEAAEACFRYAVEHQPDWSIAHNNLGWVSQAQGRNEDAISSYKCALRLEPGHVLARANLAYLLAHLYVHLGQYDAARGMWQVLVELYPQDPEVLDNLTSTALRVNDLDAAGHWALRHAAVTRGSTWHSLPGDIPDVPTPAPKLSRSKLSHDLEQMRYLRDRQLIGPQLDAVIDGYETALQRFNESDSLLQQQLLASWPLSSTYGRVIHHLPAGHLDEGALNDSPALRGAEQDYQQSPLGIVVIDDFLTPQALQQLQAFCLQSTVWHTNRYAHGRLGAFFREGFNCPLLLQVAEQIQQYFPKVIGTRHPLLQLWGFKYGHDQPATYPHADFAAVNVNFWITPDDANLDKNSGGLVIYDVEAPMDWDFETYNRQGDRIDAFLRASGAQPLVIPYRCNRAVIFNSDLFHATAPLAFRPGYTSARINITLLYGERERAGQG